MSRRVAKLSPSVVLMVDARGRRKARWYSLANLPWRALSLGANVAALSGGYLVSYNFIKLEQPDVENIVEALR
jgi:hypothetical protein